MKKKILITGGSGFIGSNIIIELINLEYDILNMDISPPKIKSHFKYWTEASILDFDKLSSSINGFKPNYIIHLAARTDLCGERLDDYNVNTIGTENLVKICNNKLFIDRVIFASSMLVNRTGSSLVELMSYNPDTIYGKSKVEMEKCILRSGLNFPWVIIRPTSIWGPWFGEPYNNFFHFVLRKMFVHPGNMGCEKTYGYIGNSVFQILKLLEIEDESLVKGKTFYIGDQPAINISEWADEISIQNSGRKNRTVSLLVFKAAALIGDMLRVIKVNFPITSFRLKNMTTDNIIPLDDLYEVVGDVPYTRLEGTVKTLEWISATKDRK